MKLTRGERFKDARTVHNRHGAQNMDAVYMATGIAKSIIHALENDDIDRSVGYDKVALLAKHYGVSIDWLLGLTEIRTPNATTAEIIKTTSLDETIIEHLIAWTTYDPVSKNSENALSQAVSEHAFWCKKENVIAAVNGILYAFFSNPRLISRDYVSIDWYLKQWKTILDKSSLHDVFCSEEDKSEDLVDFGLTAITLMDAAEQRCERLSMFLSENIMYMLKERHGLTDDFIEAKSCIK